jgi:SAM-dependent methyltransferase
MSELRRRPYPEPAPPPAANPLRCPCCGGGGLRPFYHARRVPVHLNHLAPTRAAALRAPTGDIELGFCPGCGFIRNLAFDPGLISYAADYEASQAHSPRFLAFLRELAGTLIERYRLQGKEVLEIGCGKGEFLALLSELGGCRGIGIDPGCPQPGPADDGIRLIAELYGPHHHHLEPALLVCRHTLEHLADVRAFVELVRAGLDRAPPVFFEVPDTVRILAEGAFWDIYYEHCSYFTPGSLGRLFRACGFALLDLRTGFDDQYLLLEARPGQGGLTPPDDRAEVARLVASFELRLARQHAEWRRLLDGARAAGRRVALWGGGSKGVTFLNALPAAAAIGSVVDINPRKHNLFVSGTGHRIEAPETLRAYRPDLVLLTNPAYLSEIRQQLADLGVQPEIRAL